MREYFVKPVAKQFQRSKPESSERLVYLLDHEYTERSLSFRQLKNGDRLRIAALQQAATQLDCDYFLTLAEVHETWMCEDDYRPGRYGRRAWYTRNDDESDELCFTKPSAELNPFKSEHEGYQGNYGNTVDRWYYRAALVMWPRERSFALTAQASPQWAVAQLLRLSGARSAELQAKVRTLLPRWATTAGSIGGSGTAFFAK